MAQASVRREPRASEALRHAGTPQSLARGAALPVPANCTGGQIKDPVFLSGCHRERTGALGESQDTSLLQRVSYAEVRALALNFIAKTCSFC